MRRGGGGEEEEAGAVGVGKEGLRIREEEEE